jgi:hypothetical protein
MRFIAHYIHPTKEPYYRTIDADTQNEAGNMAIRYCRKGYQIKSVRQQL